jgi:hypothetical protein
VLVMLTGRHGCAEALTENERVGRILELALAHRWRDGNERSASGNSSLSG